VFTGDGGGRAPAPVRPLHGRSRVARTLMNWFDHLTRIPGVQLRPTEVNGCPGTLLLDGEERVVGVWVLEIGRGQIQGVRSIVNPDKLAHLGPTSDLGSLLRSPTSGGGRPTS
jgi:RNA polymerase sigma-70 factor (ECF subfamily)